LRQAVELGAGVAHESSKRLEPGPAGLREALQGPAQ